MACKKVLVRGKTIILLNGFRDKSDARGPAARKRPLIEAVQDLRRTALKHPDAVAFGFVAGRWMPAA
jgi:hypothetical protein